MTRHIFYAGAWLYGTLAGIAAGWLWYSNRRLRRQLDAAHELLQRGYGRKEVYGNRN